MILFFLSNICSQIYADADRCLSILENELAKNNQRFIGGEKYAIEKQKKIRRFIINFFRFSLIDAWVSGYLLILVHHACEKSRLRTIFTQHLRLVDYIKQIDEEQLVLLKERESHTLLSSSSSENSIDIVSILHVLSQVVSFSIFFFMLTKIGANSYAITS